MQVAQVCHECNITCTSNRGLIRCEFRWLQRFNDLTHGGGHFHLPALGFTETVDYAVTFTELGAEVLHRVVEIVVGLLLVEGGGIPGGFLGGLGHQERFLFAAVRRFGSGRLVFASIRRNNPGIAWALRQANTALSWHSSP